MRYLAIATLTISFVFSAIAAPPATQKSPDELFQEIRQNLMREHEQALHDLSDLGDQKIGNLIELKREGNQLQIIPKLAPTNAPVRFTLQPRGLLGRVDFRSLNDQADQVMSAQIEFVDYTRPGDIQRSSSFFVAPQTLNISAFVQRTVDEFSVQYLQSPDGEAMTVRLIVQESSDLTGQDHSITCEAASFAELRRKNGREVQRYLAPILRDAGLEQAGFAPSLPLAQQALGVGAAVESSTVESLEPLLLKLESPEFRTRHKATLELQKLDRGKILALARADRKNWSLDRIAAVDALLAKTQIPSSAEVAELSADPMFLIDCLYLDDAAVRKEAIMRLGAFAKRPLKIEPDEKPDQRVLTIDRLVDQLIPPTRVDAEKSE